MYYCIVNPSAKSGKGKEIWDSLENRFISKSFEYKAVFTKGPGHATSLMKNLTSKERPESEYPIKVVVLGGDGTLNEALNGVADFEKVLIGYIPIGSSNDFSRDLDYPKDYNDIIDSIMEGTEKRRLDLGFLSYKSMTRPISRLHGEVISNFRYFDVSCGIGFDAAVCEEALSSGTKNFLNKIGLGKLTYGTIALKQLLGSRKIPCDIIINNAKTIHLSHFLLVTAMIHHYEGGGFNFAPKADFSDGLFDLCIVGDMPKWKMLIALPFAYVGKHYRFNKVYHYTAKSLTVKTDEPMWVHTDGEVSVKSDNVTLECKQQKLRLMN